MSIPVEIADLKKALADFGAGYLLTTATHGRIKAVTVEPTVIDGALVITEPGGGSSRNIAENAQVTVLFPPLEKHGYTLLVDGTAVLSGEEARVTPVSAVLHRPASHGDGSGAGPEGHESCGHDCQPV